MESLFYFIVRPEDDMDQVNMKRGGLIISSSVHDVVNTNRFAIVESVPRYYSGDIEVGDKLIVHHNTFRRVHNPGSVESKSLEYFDNGCYTITEDYFFAYNKGDGWVTTGKNLFVIPEEGEKNGVIAISNDTISELSVGDKVIYNPHSEYKFDIDGVIHYKMRLKDICMVR